MADNQNDNFVKKMNSSFISPFTSFGFGKVFGPQNQKDYLKDFISTLIPKYAVKDITFLTEDYHSTIRVECLTNDGEFLLIEIQKPSITYFKSIKKCFHEYSLVEYGLNSIDPNKYDHIFLIGILDFNFSENKNSISYFGSYEIENQPNLPINCIYIETKKFNISESELKGKLDQWIFILKNMESFDALPDPNKFDPIFNDFLKNAHIPTLSKEEYDSYFSSLKYYRDLKNTLDAAFERGYQEGLLIARRKRALKFLEMNLPLEDISEATSLSIDEIKKLK